jgi:pyruvate/2-oxoglutarate dehydrogenase complex dihydrolipoamide acyltransferase (E2) component
MIEIMHHAKAVPSIPVARPMNVLSTQRARLAATPRISWTALFLRAYALVCRDQPELRRAIIPYPWLHYYEHPFNVGVVAVEREFEGEHAVLMSKLRAPEERSLVEIQQHLDHIKNAPVWQVSDFRQLLRLAWLPSFLRRFVFWSSLTWSGAKRAKRFGTFSVSSYGSLGAEQIHPISPLTTLLTFGPISEAGEVVVKIVYDHRVMDGRRIAVALARLEEVLRKEMVEELAHLANLRAVA